MPWLLAHPLATWGLEPTIGIVFDTICLRGCVKHIDVNDGTFEHGYG